MPSDELITDSPIIGVLANHSVLYREIDSSIRLRSNLTSSTKATSK